MSDFKYMVVEEGKAVQVEIKPIPTKRRKRV